MVGYSSHIGWFKLADTVARKIMKKIILALFCLPTLSWASFQPVSGSTVVVMGQNNNTTAIPVSGSGNFNVANSTIGVTQAIGNWTVANSTIGVDVMNTPTVTANQGTPTNWIIGNSTIGVTQAIGNWTIANSTIGVRPGLAQNVFGNNGSAYTVGNNAPALILSSSGLMGVSIQGDNTFPTYSASTMSFTILNDTADIVGICGNSARTVQVLGVSLSGTQTTAGIVPVSIALRSSAYTGGWSTMTAVGHDQQFSVPVSSVIYQVASGNGITNGTLVGYLDSQRIGMMAPATASPNDIYISPVYWRLGTPIYLRGASQCLGVNLQGASVSGGTFTASISWKEVVSP